MANYVFYKEFCDGSVAQIENLTMRQAKKLYKEAINSWDLELKGCGWEEVREPLTLSQQIRKKKIDNKVGLGV